MKKSIFKIAGKREQSEKQGNTFKLIGSCSDLSIKNFMRCLFHADYSVLALSGKPSPDELQSKWNDIFEQYAMLTGNTQYTRLMDAMRENIRLTGKLIAVHAGLCILSVRYDREAANNIKKIGYNLKLNPEDKTGYEADLMRLVANCKTLKAKISIQNNEIEKMQEESSKVKPQTEGDFMQGLVIIGKYMGFHINIDAVSIAEYAVMQNDYQRYVDIENAKSLKGKMNG